MVILLTKKNSVHLYVVGCPGWGDTLGCFALWLLLGQEQMARIIGWQYAVAPILLSITVTLVVHIASQP
jgi:hypothetical protein